MDIIAPPPINWHDWKDVCIRIGIPVGLAVFIGYLTITGIIDFKECLDNMDGCDLQW